MNTRTICSLAMYLALIVSIEALAALMPQFNMVLMLLSWSVSAIYVELLDLGTWLKVRLMLEATKLPKYYQVALQTDMIGSASNKLLQITYAIRPEARDGLVVEQLVLENTGWMVPVMAVLITYGGIFIIHRYLCRIGFFRRIVY